VKLNADEKIMERTSPVPNCPFSALPIEYTLPEAHKKREKDNPAVAAITFSPSGNPPTFENEETCSFATG
jgi:hypothetical protein